jgi:hypothetical protein
MKKEKEKIKVVKEKKACEMLGCKRTKFHEIYKPQLTPLKAENGYHTFYSLDEINKIIEKEKKLKRNILPEGEYEIVE